MVESSKEHILDRIYRLNKRIDYLKSREYVTNEPKLFLTSLSYYLKNFLVRLNYIHDENITSIRRIGHILQIVHMNLDEIEHIETTNIPIDLIPVLNNILDSNNAKYNVIFRPGTEFNYSYWNYSQFMTEACSGLGILTDQLLSVISYPLSESDNVLLNCILFHEIGHQINEELEIRKNIEQYIKISGKDMDAYVEEWVSRFSDIRQVIGESVITLETFFSQNDIIKSILVEELYDILHSWLDELISDLIAFNYMGIPFLLASTEFCYVQGVPTKSSDSHPPLFLRLKCIFKLYNKQRYGYKMSKYRNITRFIFKYKEIGKISYKTLSNIKEIHKYIILEKTIEKCLPHIFDELEKSLSLPNKMWTISHIDNAIKLLMDLIPPAEYINYDTKSKRNHTPYTILTAAWIVKENNKNKLKDIFNNDLQKARITINKITSKALDISEFQTKMVKNNDDIKL